MSSWKVYAILGESPARAKIITETGTGKILGAHLFTGGAPEEIHLFALAIKFGITADALKNMVFAYPTLASALPYVFA